MLPALTGLRFFAALQVFLFHSSWRFASRFSRVIDFGASAVSLFFVLSGFIIAYAYLDETRPVDRQSFYRARFARVYPVYLVGLIAGLPFYLSYALRPGVMWSVVSTVAITAGLGQAWNPRIACAVNCVGWSLSVETAFYLIFPLIAAGLIRQTPSRALRSAATVWVASLLLAAIWMVDGGSAYIELDLHVFRGGALRFFRYYPLIRLPELIFGAYVGRWFLARRVELETRASAWGWVAVGAAAATIMAYMYWPDEWWPFMHNGLLAPLYALTIVGLAAGRGPLVRMLSSPLLLLLGESSYALYLLHVPIREGYASLVSRGLVVDDASLGGLLLRLLVTVAVCVVVYRWFEEPMRRWIAGRPSAVKR